MGNRTPSLKPFRIIGRPYCLVELPTGKALQPVPGHRERLPDRETLNRRDGTDSIYRPGVLLCTQSLMA